ncbi:hypothetical protein Acr_15g0019840 [Actinidia rufa]|uniref:ENDOSPERM DEFECTIVE protein n=1 Tax=Actinidia rufa TaxID=165716 RepID=A0A7J0FXH4_9ERIC|nr:hypothetical protein Acr_15g0019840 [Actinidia rufa]
MKGEMADQVQPSTLGYEQQQVAVPPPPPPPLPHRRPRVREVSSRFMSSVIVSSTTTTASPGDLHHHVPKSPLPKHTSTLTTQQQHRSRSVQRQRSSQDLEPLCTRADDNILPDTTRSLQTPSLGSSPPPHINNRVTVTASAQRKKRLKENGGGRLLDQHSDHFWQSRSRKCGGGGGNVTPSISRPDTPIPTLTTARSQNQNQNQNSVRGVTAAAKLFKSSVNRDTSQEITSFPLDSCSMGNNTRVEKDVIAYPSSPISVQNQQDHNHSVSSRFAFFLARGGCVIHQIVGRQKLHHWLQFVKVLCFPLLPFSKFATVNGDMQMQRTEASAHAQRRETERELYSLQVKISVLRDSVKKKRIEFGQLGRTKTLSTVLEAHMSYLDEWSTLEGEYLSSLSGATHALLNASVQLPFCGNVQVDVREVWEALNSAIKMTESIGVHIHRFMPKAEEMDALISELARVAGGERALMADCGDLLFNTYTSQVEECSLRGNLIQLHCSNHHQPQ